MSHSESQWNAWLDDDASDIRLDESAADIGSACAAAVVDVMIDHAPRDRHGCWSTGDFLRVAAACARTYSSHRHDRSDDAYGYADVGQQYARDMYPGVTTDTLIGFNRRDYVRIGRALVASQRGDARVVWHECSGCAALHWFDAKAVRGVQADVSASSRQ